MGNSYLPFVFGQLTLGLINGAFYALLSLGLSLIFGHLRIVNFAHGAFFMLGATLTWIFQRVFGLDYWWALVFVPLVIGAFGALFERTLISRLYTIDHLYGLLFTFGFALFVEGIFKNQYGTTGLRYDIPIELRSSIRLTFMQLPNYRIWVVGASLFVCLATWAIIEKTRLGSVLRAGTENPELVRAFGIRLPLLITLVYAAGVGLAAFAGVLAAPIYSINADMGSGLLIVAFAVVVIGGMGSIIGSIVIGFGLGLAEALSKVLYAQASSTVIFVIMTVVLLSRPAGLFGKDA